MNAEEFWKNVSKGQEDSCWEWQRYKTERGYGYVRFRGRKRYAHRVAYVLTAGKIPKGMCVCHTCDNPSCVNPAHLFLGSQADNIRDMVKKGRQSQGEAHYLSKLTEDDITEIRSHIGEPRGWQVRAAQKYGVDPQLISLIVRGKIWKGV